MFAVFAAGHRHRRQDVDEVLLCLHPSSKDSLRFILLYAIYLEYTLFGLQHGILLLYYCYLTMDHHHPGMDMGHGGHGDMDMGGGQCNMNVSLLYIYTPDMGCCS